VVESFGAGVSGGTVRTMLQIMESDAKQLQEPYLLNVAPYSKGSPEGDVLLPGRNKVFKDLCFVQKENCGVFYQLLKGFESVDVSEFDGDDQHTHRAQDGISVSWRIGNSLSFKRQVCFQRMERNSLVVWRRHLLARNCAARHRPAVSNLQKVHFRKISGRTG
jgi:hypothetical protein